MKLHTIATRSHCLKVPERQSSSADEENLENVVVERSFIKLPFKLVLYNTCFGLRLGGGSGGRARTFSRVCGTRRPEAKAPSLLSTTFSTDDG